MIDQRVSEGEKINFFNKMAYTTTLPAQLALKYNLSIIPVFIKRDDNNNFKIEFYNEIKSSEYDVDVVSSSSSSPPKQPVKLVNTNSIARANTLVFFNIFCFL